MGSVFSKLQRLIYFPLIVLPYEFFMRLKEFLSPSTYSFAKRTLKTYRKDIDKQITKAAIISIFSRNGIGDDLLALLQACKKKDISIISVCNGPLKKEDLETLKPYSDILHIRQNIGRDIGGYKDGIFLLEEFSDDLEILYLFNDSVFYIKQNIEPMLDHFSTAKKISGATESLEPEYHLQSYALVIPKPILKNHFFWDYWRKYLPISTRRWAVVKGEIGFTRFMKKHGLIDGGIYNIYNLAVSLQNDSNVISNIYGYVQESYQEKLKNKNQEKYYLSKFNYTSNNSSGSHQEKTRRYKVDIETILTDDIINTTLHYVYTGSQIHTAGFLFAKFLTSPFIKKDIVFKNVYNLASVFLILTKFNIEQHEIKRVFGRPHYINRKNYFEKVLISFGFK